MNNFIKYDLVPESDRESVDNTSRSRHSSTDTDSGSIGLFITLVTNVLIRYCNKIGDFDCLVH